MKKKEINYQLLIRRIGLIVLDIICIIAASILALLTRFEFDFSQIPKEFLKVIYKYGPFTIVITLIIFSLFRIYSSLWEYAGIEEVFSLIAACLVAAVAKIVIILFTWSVMPRSWYVLDTIYLMILIGATNVCIDSDDRMAKGAVKKIKTAWLKVRNKNYAGLIGLDADMNTGRIIGKGFPDGLKETTLGGYYASGGEGDKKLVYRTDVINSVPQYPVFEGEKYVGLVYKYTLIDQKYKLFVMNDVLCDVEYQTDGSSNTMFRQYLKNPKGFAFLRKVAMTYPTSKKRLIRDCIHYCSSSLIAGNKKYIVESPRKLLTVLCTPLGCILTSIIRKKAINN